MRNRFAISAAAALTFAITPHAHADITGTIDATITLSAGCIINGQSHDNGAASADFGTLDFGTHNTLFTEADGEVLSGGSALEIQCSPGIAPVLSLGAGQHDGEGAGAGARAMAHGSTAGHYVTYNIYSDAGRTTVVPIDGDIPLAATGALQTVNLYGRAFGEPDLITGAYGDVITVLLEL